LARFLSDIVEARLRGEEGGIKAYSIAVDVFGRPQSFDPQSDPIVRVQARRLRALLDQFYDEGHARTGVRIQLPIGRYVPEFVELVPNADGDDQRVRDAQTTDATQGEFARPRSDADPRDATDSPESKGPLRRSALWEALIAGGFVLAAGLVVFLIQTRPPPTPLVAPPIMPSLAIGEFANLTGNTDLDGFGPQVAEALRQAITPMEDLRLLPAGEAPGEDGFQLSGVIHPAPSGVEVTASLTQGASEALWTGVFARPTPADNAGEAAGDVAHAITREIAPFRGPLHDGGRHWLDEQRRPLQAVNGYVCLLTYRLARETGDSNNIADSLACHERLLLQQPDLPLALTSEAWLETRALANRELPGDALNAMLAKPLAEAERAVALAPQSSIAQDHLASIKNWQMQFDAAQERSVEALRLNPLNTDARANYAIILARALEWTLAGEQAALAIRDAAFPSPWYFFPAALNAFRGGQLQEAIMRGQIAAEFANGEVATVVTLAAAHEANRKDVVGTLRPRMMAMENLRRTGIMPWLAGQITDPQVLDRIANDLKSAGIPENALTGPF
jgi:hypothetical protein